MKNPDANIPTNFAMSKIITMSSGFFDWHFNYFFSYCPFY